MGNVAPLAFVVTAGHTRDASGKTRIGDDCRTKILEINSETIIKATEMPCM